MIYLLDTNTLIDANRDYYGLKIVPQFWEWLIHMGQKGLVKIPLEIYEELKVGNDDLAEWVKTEEVEQSLLYSESADPKLVNEVLDSGYGPNLSEDGPKLSDVQIEKIGRDPFLISYALADLGNIIVVTTENPKPSITEPSNKKIPDVCDKLKIKRMHTFKFIKELGFSTNWNIPEHYRQ